MLSSWLRAPCRKTSRAVASGKLAASRAARPRARPRAAYAFARRVTELERRPDRLLARPVITPAARALVKRYRKHRAHLLVSRSVHDPQIPHHNNDAERALRPSVTQSDRKVTGGFRSAWGADVYAALASMIDTSKLRGQSVFATLVALMGPPVLPYFAAPGASAVTVGETAQIRTTPSWPAEAR